MEFDMRERKTRYILRYAAGLYWLLDIEQPGLPYRKPIPMNELGAEIWRLLADGKTVEDVVCALHEEYEADMDEIRQDVISFLESLQKQGV